MQLKTLSAADAPQYRELMLEAYVQAADAFTSTAEERESEPLSWWVDRIASPAGLGQSFGAFDEQQLVGTVALEYSAKPKTRHSALVIGMYVRAQARRQGAGLMLMHAAIGAARARPGLLMLRLTVTEGNSAALALYESVGFSAWGIEPMAILTPSGYRGKVHMAMPLRGDDRPEAS
jgi:GNAT superfamily N-acetyltransferase